jgi:hypothetical protein
MHLKQMTLAIRAALRARMRVLVRSGKPVGARTV